MRQWAKQFRLILIYRSQERRGFFKTQIDDMEKSYAWWKLTIENDPDAKKQRKMKITAIGQESFILDLGFSSCYLANVVKLQALLRPKLKEWDFQFKSQKRTSHVRWCTLRIVDSSLEAWFFIFVIKKVRAFGLVKLLSSAKGIWNV